MSGVSSLFSRSLDVLVKHIDKVSSLGGLPEEVLVALFQTILEAGKLTEKVLKLLLTESAKHNELVERVEALHDVVKEARSDREKAYDMWLEKVQVWSPFICDVPDEERRRVFFEKLTRCEELNAGKPEKKWNNLPGPAILYPKKPMDAPADYLV